MHASPNKLAINKRGKPLGAPSPTKARHCTLCNRPMLGHPRGRCPEDTPAFNLSPTKGKVSLRGRPQELHRIPTQVEQVDRRRRRSSIPTPLAAVAELPSLTAGGKQVMQRLLQSGIMDDEMITDEDRNRANVLRWLGDVVGPQATIGPIHANEREPPSPIRSSQGQSFAAGTPRPGHSRTTLTAEASLPQIVKQKAAHAIVVDVDNIVDTTKEIENQGLVTRALWPPKDSQKRQGWLVVGRDRVTVDALVSRMLNGS